MRRIVTAIIVTLSNFRRFNQLYNQNAVNVRKLSHITVKNATTVGKSIIKTLRHNGHARIVQTILYDQKMPFVTTVKKQQRKNENANVMQNDVMTKNSRVN